MTSAENGLARALGLLEQRGGEIIGLTERLVRINSFTGNVAGVNSVGELLRVALLPAGLAIHAEKSATTGDHLTFSTPAAASSAPILLIGHHDTVFPPGTFEGFEVDGDIARGPGVLDMKGGLAMVVNVLLALAEAELLSALPIQLVSVADEEVGSPSSRTYLQSLAKRARAALVFEAGRAGDAIITARRGSGFAIVTAHGKAAHAGNALSSGQNAIWAISKFIDAVQALTDEARGTSVNVGLVSGGTTRNTVPARAQCELDLRFCDEAAERDLTSSLKSAARAAAAAVPGTSVEVAIEISRKPWARTGEHAALCARYATCQHKAGLEGREAPRMGGGSDGNTVAALGVPTIDGLGPRGSGFHTHDEQISISSLPLKAEALLRFLLGELRAPLD